MDIMDKYFILVLCCLGLIYFIFTAHSIYALFRAYRDWILDKSSITTNSILTDILADAPPCFGGQSLPPCLLYLL